jgi:hypothetical protein
MGAYKEKRLFGTMTRDLHELAPSGYAELR